MTEERIRDIIVENDVHLTDVIIKAMKQAVNEALEEAAENGTLLDPVMNIKCKSGHGFVVDKQSTLNLKVK